MGKIPREVWALGFVSLFMDVSSEIVHGILPVFLVSVLGASFTSVGLLEGLAEATTLVAKVFSGVLSDRLARRKPLVVLGYAVAALSKPLFALASTIPLVYGARLFDRLGKGIRGAPRDALIADITSPAVRGRAFGLRQSLDTIGAFLGPIAAIILLSATHENYRAVFWVAVLPALVSVLILVVFVREKPPASKTVDVRSVRLKDFDRSFWFVVGIAAVLQVARFSEAFLILRVRSLGLGIVWAPAVLIVMNLVYALSAYPLGWLSDHLKKERLIFLGFGTLLVAQLVLAVSEDYLTAFLGIVLWGLQMGMTQGVLAAMVADTVSENSRGTGFGILNLLSALALLIGSTLAGALWDMLGAQAAFFAGALLTFVGALLFWLIRPRPQLCG